MGKMYKLIKPVLFSLDPEVAHKIAHSFLKSLSYNSGDQLNLLGSFFSKIIGDSCEYPELQIEVFGREFKNPLGLAAGFDKNAELIPAISALGFGFMEVGSVTHKMSRGNNSPRLFRLPQDKALINRLGLPNAGGETIFSKLKKLNPKIPLGINIAKTHSKEIYGENAVADYACCTKMSNGIGDFLVINISCPNTEDGKSFEDKSALSELLSEIYSIREIAKDKRPLLVKFSSDLNIETLESLLEICEEKKVDGYVFSNTTNSRESLKTPGQTIDKIGRGGLSGPPLRSRSLTLLAHTYKRLDGEKTLIGLGGIDSPETAYNYIKAGASLLELYTGLIYHGPGLVYTIKAGLTELLKRNGFSNIKEAIGCERL